MRGIFRPPTREDVRFLDHEGRKICVVLLESAPRSPMQEGVHFPISINAEENYDLAITLHSREYQAASITMKIRMIEELRAELKAVVINTFLSDGSLRAALVLEEPQKMKLTVRACECWVAILCAIYFTNEKEKKEVPIEIEEEVIARQLGTEIGELVAERL